MTVDKCWAIYNSLLAVLKQLDSTREPQLHTNVSNAVSSAKGLLQQLLNAEGT